MPPGSRECPPPAGRPRRSLLLRVRVRARARFRVRVRVRVREAAKAAPSAVPK